MIASVADVCPAGTSTLAGTVARRPGAGDVLRQLEHRRREDGQRVLEWAQELRGIRGARPVTERELDSARTNRVAGMPATMESNDPVAEAVANLPRNALPADHYQQYARRVCAVTGADVVAVATRYVDPEGTAVVIVDENGSPPS